MVQGTCPNVPDVPHSCTWPNLSSSKCGFHRLKTLSLQGPSTQGVQATVRILKTAISFRLTDIGLFLVQDQHIKFLSESCLRFRVFYFRSTGNKDEEQRIGLRCFKCEGIGIRDANAQH